MGLFKPAWMSKNRKRALNAVEKESDQLKLEKIAKDDSVYNIDVSIAAIKKLTDQFVLADIAKNDTNTIIGITAVTSLVDQKCLFDLALNSDCQDIREAAAIKITSRGLVEE